MHKYLSIHLATLCLLLLASISPILAQCNGDRYLNSVFTAVNDTQNIKYSYSNGATGLRMDVYEPAGDINAPARPLIIMAHGGSFTAGDENSADIVEICTRFAKHGYVAASIQYRLANLTQLIDSTQMIGVVLRAVHDMKASVRYFREDAATVNRFNIDSTKIFVGGASAGAILAAHLVYLNDLTEVPTYIADIVAANGGIDGSSGYPNHSSTVQGLINFCGGLNKAEWIDAGDVPLVSIHGNVDSTVPYGHGEVLQSSGGALFDLVTLDGSQIMHARAESEGVYNALWTIAGGEHMVHTDAAHIDQTETFVCNFLYPLVCTDVNGIESAEQFAFAVSIAPNPNQGTFHVQLPQENGTYQVALFDAVGKQLAQYSQVSGGTFDIAQNLAKGIYWLQVNHAKGTVTKPIVVIE